MGEVGWTGSREGEKMRGLGFIESPESFYFARCMLFRGRLVGKTRTLLFG